MWVELFLCILLAHLVADYVFQTSASCKNKMEKHWCSVHQYIHALIVFGLTWLVSWDVDFWLPALFVGLSHFAIDIWKSYRPDNIKWFVVDQISHVLVLGLAAYLWREGHCWAIPSWGSLKYVVVLISVLICWKPANIFIKLLLKQNCVKIPEENKDAQFNAGALIGVIERWLILVFVCLGHYEALGLLVAAKSIIRFSDSQTNKTEYVLAGTLLSIFLAVLCGLFIVSFEKWGM